MTINISPQLLWFIIGFMSGIVLNFLFLVYLAKRMKKIEDDIDDSVSKM